MHPHLTDELFAQRLGSHEGSNRVYASTADAGIQVSAAYTSPSLVQSTEDFELPQIRGEGRAPTLPAMDGLTPVAIRVAMPATPPSGLPGIPLAPANVRLVIDGHDYYPVGVREGDDKTLLTRPDDLLFMAPGKTPGFLFLVNSEMLKPEEGSGALKFPAGSFIEVKRTGRAELGGKVISTSAPAGSDGIIEKDRASQR